MKNPYHDNDHHPSAVVFGGKWQWIQTLVFLLGIITVPVARHLAEFGKPAEERWFPLVEIWRHPNQKAYNLLFEKKNKNPEITREEPNLRDHLQSYQDGINDSDLRKQMRKGEQAWLYRWFQTGNRKVVIGKNGWLYYQPAVDALTGIGPLKAEPDSVTKDPDRPMWTPALPVITAFASQLRERGIELMIVPIPVKTMIHPEGLGGTGILQHPEQDRFYKTLREQGISVIDLLPLFEKAKINGDVFLRQDTHWRAGITKLVAQHIGQEISGRAWYQALPKTLDPVFETIERSGAGDLVEMLGLPEGQRHFEPEIQSIERVLDSTTRQTIQDDLFSPISILGDSFVNIYEEPGLGFGSGSEEEGLIGGGLGSHLAAYLKIRPQIIALNGEGATGVRQQFASLPDNVVRSKKIVIWAIAARDFLLSESAANRAGVIWREVTFNPETEDIPKFEFRNSNFYPETVITGTLKQKSAIEDPAKTPYTEAIYSTVFSDLEVESGIYEETEAFVYLWAFQNRKLLPSASLEIGKRYRLTLVPFDTQTEISRKTQLSDFVRFDLEHQFATEVEDE